MAGIGCGWDRIWFEAGSGWGGSVMGGSVMGTEVLVPEVVWVRKGAGCVRGRGT